MRGDDPDQDEAEIETAVGAIPDDWDDIPLDPPPSLLQSSADFVRDFRPPEYLIDGIMQGRFIYSMTGSTGSGKTSVSLEIGRCIATGERINGHEVERGHVFFFAGENPDDVRQRWIAMAEHVPFDPDTISVHFMTGERDLSKLRSRLFENVSALGEARLIIIDTAAAFFLGSDENSNAAMGAYARTLRTFTTFPGNPTVLVNCHPSKRANDENLLPRGGGAFLAEVDGNLTCERANGVVNIGWQGKFRGADFDPLKFEMQPVTARLLRTAKGKAIATVLARQISDEEHNARILRDRDAAEDILALMDRGEMSIAGMCAELGLISANGKPQKSTLYRRLENLAKAKLVEKSDGTYRLTSDGRKAAGKVRK